MPLIGVTACDKLEDYRQSILHVGGEVLILDPSMEVADALRRIDGLLLTGGEDVAPALFGDPPHPKLGEVNARRDAFELALIAEARARQLPLFAICRGIQILNVAFGGSLVQDIPSETPGALEHRLTTPPHQPFELAHEIWIEPDSLLARLMRERLSDADSCEVNSRHHQAVKRLGTGLQMSATAPDGVIEAIEDPSMPFCLGVQWHPENFFRTGEFRPLFEGFVDAANPDHKR
ncbi:MAG TPA: gamma-glutamyl-gamma-aminobutyrate hydrolase family protein [Vicinamibacterales bacterium]|jgi:putative glutamine amidotransferase|nr:gamma-glutamyl-gamma-aminobutyrate hydrolase family protein [Vicinamibacterales bacterium]